MLEIGFAPLWESKKVRGGTKYCIVTDPPFNVGYHYEGYDDNMEEGEYYEWLGDILTTLDCPYVVIHYPEELYKVAFQVGEFPDRIVSRVYNSNTARQDYKYNHWSRIRSSEDTTWVGNRRIYSG